MMQNDVFKGRYSTYQLQDVIGKGGNAVVYSALDKITQKTVAIKRMFAADESTLHRWRIEVEALIALREQGGTSQFVVAYLDHMQAGKAIMLVEEYAPNGSLLGLLRRRENHGRGLDESRVVAYMYQITRGLAFIHSKSIVHRDLKCANVLLFDEDRLLKISDFGLAAGGPPLQSLTAANAEVEGDQSSNKGEEEGVLGSIYWMAPEIACGRPHSKSSDVWSLGCLCVELLTGKPPFFNRQPVNALYCIAEGKVSPMPQDVPLSDDCRSFLQECFNAEPQRRPSAAKLVQHRWFSELRIDNRLAELAAQSRGAGSREPSVLAESGHTASVPTGLLSGSGSSMRELWSPNTSMGRPRSGASSPPALQMSGAAIAAPALVDDGDEEKAGLGQVVEHALFSKPAAQCEQWLQGHGLKHVVDSLADAIPGEAYNVLRSIAYAARSREAKHRIVPNCLGETDLWQCETLLQPTTRTDLAVIFTHCCERQSPDVPRYTPCDCQALHFLLSPDPNDADDVNRIADATAVAAAHDAVAALHGLFVSSPSTDPAAVAVSEEATAAAHRRAHAMRLFVLGGGFEQVRRVLERQCERSLRTTSDPPLGWPAVSQLFEILSAVEAGVSPLSAAGTAAGDATMSSGSGGSERGGGDNVLVAATACRLMWGTYITTNLYGAQALKPTSAGSSLNAATAASLTSGLLSPVSNPLVGASGPVAGAGNSSIAVPGGGGGGGPGSEGTGPSTPHTAAPPATLDANDGQLQQGAQSPGAGDAPIDIASVAGASPTVRWFLGLQHASRSHHCPPAVPLLLRYAALSVLVHAPSLDEDGRWLARSVVLLASYPHEPPVSRIHALEVLAGLAQTSALARVALRDADVVVPILASMILSPPLIDRGLAMVLQFMQAVCVMDSRFATIALAVGSPVLPGLVNALHSALQLAGLGAAEPVLSGDEAVARAAQLAEAATAQGRYPLEEIDMCLAMLSQAVALPSNSGANANAGPAQSGAASAVGGGAGEDADHAVRFADGMMGVLVEDLEAMRGHLLTGNAAANSLSATAQSLLAQLAPDMQSHT